MHFVHAQALAAAHGTTLSFGGLHSAALLVRNDRGQYDECGRQMHRLYTWGRGFHGQLGRTSSEIALYPRSVQLGFRPYSVRSSDVGVSCSDSLLDRSNPPF